MKARRFLSIAGCAAGLAIAAGSARGGTFTVTPFTGDADSGISPLNNYVDAVDLGGTSPESVNLVPFTAGGLSGSNYTITGPGTPAYTGYYANGATGSFNGILSNFFYGGSTTTYLFSSLTPGQTYSVRLYSAPFGGAGDRVQTVTSGNDTDPSFDENAGIAYLNYTFTAATPRKTLALVTQSGGNTYHNYGFTNQTIGAPIGIQGLYGTGVDATGAPLPDSTVGDPHYTLRSVPAGSSSTILTRTSAGGFPVAPYGPYIGDDGLSSWIGADNAPDLTSPTGAYDYHTSFTITQLIPGETINGLWATDDSGTDILVNNMSTGQTTAGFSSFSPFSISSDLHVGLNTLDFITYNGSGPGALRVEFTDITGVPEPAALSTLTLAAAALLTRRRREPTC